MKILALHDGGSGCMYFRMRVPLEALAANGYDVTFLAVGDGDNYTPGKEPARYPGITVRHDSAVPSVLRDYDVIIGQRINMYSGLEAWRRSRGPFNRLVFETDDDVFAVRPENWNSYRTYSRLDVRDATVHACEVSDLVTVSTPVLGKVMSEFNPRVAVLGNCLPDWAPDIRRRPTTRPCIGWRGGLSHGLDVGIIIAPVQRFLDSFGDWDFRIGGADYRKSFEHSRVYHRRWVPINMNPRDYFAAQRMDIGLAPIDNNRFNDSKSFLKVLEYAALGIPSIASAWGPYPGFVRHGENGFLASTEDEWVEYMSLLASDDNLREKLGVQAREDARKHTIGQNWRKWADAYEGLFRRDPG